MRTIRRDIRRAGAGLKPKFPPNFGDTNKWHEELKTREALLALLRMEVSDYPFTKEDLSKMSTIITCYGECISCGRLMAFHPDYVPSIRPYNEGEKEPLCHHCFDKWRALHNQPELTVHPLAYPSESGSGGEEV